MTTPVFRYVVITPARDEAAHIEHTIASMVAQTLLPVEWVIVDDGSTDGTAAILDAAAAAHPWMHVCHRSDRGRRLPGLGVMQAVGEGLRCLSTTDWAFLVKLDADLSFAPDYFASSLKHFATEPRLGIAGGVVCHREGDTIVAEGRGDPPFHVRGATKIYRAACWMDIGGLFAQTGWDTIDEVKANMLGWHTRTFGELRLLQHRVTGGVEGPWRDAVKNGRANYITGYHPIFMLCKCFRRIFHRPRGGGDAAGLAWGFFSSYLHAVPRVPDMALIRYVREQQWRRLSFRSSLWQ
ncbi:MAG: glycosyltransferase family 2 protein [Phycisphaerae bacterium]